MSDQAERLDASETWPPEAQVPASETVPPEAVQRRLKRCRDGQPLYPAFQRPAASVTFCTSSPISKVHPDDLGGLLDSLEKYVGRFPCGRQFSPRTRVVWMREDIKRGLLGPRPVAVNVSSGEPVRGNGTWEWGSWA